jgi:UDP-glucose 4-epimerase
MSRVVVTGGRSPLGRRVVQALRAHADVESVRGIEARSGGKERDDDEVDVVSFVPDHRPLVDYLEKEGIDTLVQCDLAPDRGGRGASAREADVIGTMCLGAAIGHRGSPIRSWVLASSSAVYPIGSRQALIQSERQELAAEAGTQAASIAEAEEYARDVALRLPHLNVAILRLQQLAGEQVRGPLASLLARALVPSPIGFDPLIQLLHSDDAVSALAFAARSELAGVYNVASAGWVHWGDAVRATGHTAFPVLPLSLALFDPLLDRLPVPALFAPADLLDLLRFGQAIDIQKIERAGWEPRRDQLDCLSALRSDAA